MGFFDSLTKERKLQAIDARADSLKSQLYGTMVSVGIDPDEVDMETFDPAIDIPEEFSAWREQFSNALEALEQIAQIRAKVAE